MNEEILCEELSDEARNIIESRPRSIGALLEMRATSDPDRVGWRYPVGEEQWAELTWSEFRDRVHMFAAGLADLGVEPEQRMGIIAGTRLDWCVADLANNCVGGATTTVYPNTMPDDVEYLLEHSESRIVVAENLEMAAKVTCHDSLRESVRHIILMDGEPDGSDERLMSWNSVVERGTAALETSPSLVSDRIEQTGPDTLATLIYTSGTTGRPKGVELTHDNWLFEAASMKTWNLLLDTDVHFVWLPMAHVFGKDLIVINMFHNCITAIDGRLDKIVSNLATVRPTVMCAAPRIFEKVRAAAITQASPGSLKGRIARWAFVTGRRAGPYLYRGREMPRALKLKFALADKLVFSKLRAKLGGRMRFLVSGSAKLDSQIQKWFHAAGLTIVEGYGMTETTAIATLNDPATLHFGTVGAPAPGTQLKLADDGEILVKGPHITRGYHQRPELNAELFTDGWLHTGDIGEFDRGHVRITDRKKDLIKTSGGKYVSPQKVESTIVATCPYVSQAVAIGEGRKYVSAFVVMDPDSLKKWAEKRDIKGSYAELTQLPQIRASVERYIQRANERLERWETVKRFAILSEEFSVDDDTVTPNMKIRRKQVIDKHAALLEELYDAEPDA